MGFRRMQVSRRGEGQLLVLAVCALLAASLVPAPAAAVRSPRARAAQANPFESRGMWIWLLADSNHGNLRSIIAQAHRYRINTLYIKSSDGASIWSQFSRSMVATLHAGGLRVCAWQYVYGDHPIDEAVAGATAVRDGADCLVIDAESEYEGKYSQAQRYITRLRQLIGSSFPVALAGFPYVDYHPSFPYSVFLGPSGAQYDMPQMYWRSIGNSVADVYAHTYTYNLPYQRPIVPLGQAFSVPASQVKRFRQMLALYDGTGVSWWDWQQANSATWRALSVRVAPLQRTDPTTVMPLLRRGAAGDLVVWAQEHLVSAGEQIAVDGGFGPLTQRAVEAFQQAHGFGVDGVIGPQTWSALLAYQPARINWSKARSGKATRRSASLTAAAVAAADTARGRATGARGPQPAPLSAQLPDRGKELGSLGAGRP